MESVYDFEGTEIKVNDSIIYYDYDYDNGNSSVVLTKGIVVEITEKEVFINFVYSRKTRAIQRKNSSLIKSLYKI